MMNYEPACRQTGCKFKLKGGISQKLIWESFVGFEPNRNNRQIEKHIDNPTMHLFMFSMW